MVQVKTRWADHDRRAGASLLFHFYEVNFGNYEATCGANGGVPD
jgi:hypothetical protein